MEWYIIIVLLGLLGLALGLNVVLITYYENPEDGRSNQGLIAKLVALVGFELCWLMLCVVPTDGFNVNHEAGLDVVLLWEMVGPLVLLFMLFPMRFATSYYEADLDPRVTRTAPWTRALRSGALQLLVGLGFLVVLYFAMRRSASEVCPNGALSGDTACWKQRTTVPFLLFPWLLMGFFGWFVAVIFLGVGVVSCPLGLIYGFFHRARAISRDEYLDAKTQLGEQAAALKLVGEELRGRVSSHKMMPRGVPKLREGRAINGELNRFRQSVHVLESELAALDVALHLRGENPVVSYCKLLAGLLALVLSALWVENWLAYIIIPQLIRRPLQHAGVMNVLMQQITRANFYGLDLTMYLLLVGYLLLAMASGCFRFNMRMFCCLSIHPLQKGKTHLNSLLFNCALLLIGASAIIHLSVDSLQHYLHGSMADTIYLQYARHLPVFGLFYRSRVFYWALIIWSFVCLVVLSFKPADAKAFSMKNLNKLRKQLARKKEGAAGGTAAAGLASVENDVEKAVGKAEKLTKVLF